MPVATVHGDNPTRTDPQVSPAQSESALARIEEAILQLRTENNWLKRVDPRVKLLAILLFTLSNMIMLDVRLLGALSISVLLLWLTTPLRLGTLLPSLAVFAVFILGITMSQALAPVAHLTGPTPDVLFTAGDIVVSVESLQIGFGRAIRMVNPLLFGLLIAVNSDPLLITRGFARLRLPMEPVFMLLSALRFFPLVAARASAIRDAQKIRGIGGAPGTRTWAMMFPLMLGSLRDARAMGVTMECKAFSAKRWNAFLREIRFTAHDIPLLIYSVTVFLCAFWIVFFSGWEISRITLGV